MLVLGPLRNHLHLAMFKVRKTLWNFREIFIFVYSYIFFLVATRTNAKKQQFFKNLAIYFHNHD